MTFVFDDLTGGQGLDLSDLQGNILRSARPLRSEQVFHRFDGPKQLAKWLLSKEAEPSSAGQQNGTVTNVLLSAAGLSLLQADESALSRMDSAFLQGSRHPRTI